DDPHAGAGELASAVGADALEAQDLGVELERRVRVALEDVGEEMGVAALHRLGDGGAHQPEGDADVAAVAGQDHEAADVDEAASPLQALQVDARLEGDAQLLGDV